MSDNQPQDTGLGSPLTVAASSARVSGTAHDRKGQRLKGKNISIEGGMLRLLRAMKEASGLSFSALAERMGIQRSSLTQYFYQRRGSTGSSNLSWFLRFAEACGCAVWLDYPSKFAQEQLKAQYQKPIGNPAWKKKAPNGKAE